MTDTPHSMRINLTYSEAWVLASAMEHYIRFWNDLPAAYRPWDAPPPVAHHLLDIANQHIDARRGVPSAKAMI